MRGVLDKDLVQLEIHCDEFHQYQLCSKSVAIHVLDFVHVGWRFLINPRQLREINKKGFSEIHPNILILGAE